ncbi:hypothetical protein Droror1_Dr00019971 [Drosera rotundifolia]
MKEQVHLAVKLQEELSDREQKRKIEDQERELHAMRKIVRTEINLTQILIYCKLESSALMIHDWAFTDTRYILFGNRIKLDASGSANNMLSNADVTDESKLVSDITGLKSKFKNAESDCLNMMYQNQLTMGMSECIGGITMARIQDIHHLTSVESIPSLKNYLLHVTLACFHQRPRVIFVHHHERAANDTPEEWDACHHSPDQNRDERTLQRKKSSD